MRRVKTIVLQVPAAREFDALNQSLRDRVTSVLVDYAVNPQHFANQVKMLKGSHLRRLRVGDWRIVFDETDAQIIVRTIANRRDVYR